MAPLTILGLPNFHLWPKLFNFGKDNQDIRECHNFHRKTVSFTSLWLMPICLTFFRAVLALFLILYLKLIYIHNKGYQSLVLWEINNDLVNQSNMKPEQPQFLGLLLGISHFSRNSFHQFPEKQMLKTDLAQDKSGLR